MRKETLRLVLMASGIYYAILFFASGFFPADFAPPAYFLVGPILVLVLIFASDLSRRATVPTEVEVRNPPSRTLSREVQQLSRRIEVGANSSASYFDSLLLARLREILAARVALETGMELEHVRAQLANPQLGPGLLRNDALHRLLYRPQQAKKAGRVRLLEEAITKIEAWKG